MSTSSASTLFQQSSDFFGTAAAATSLLSDEYFADAVISGDLASFDTMQDSKDFGLKPSSTNQRFPRRIKKFPITQVASKRRSFQETASWEGVVIQINEEGIVAKLTKRYQDFPAEEAVIPWQEIDESDHDVALEGAPFSWKVGYLDLNGQRLSVSHIEFGRIRNFTAFEQANAESKAKEYAALFNG
jgi:hypothetical protein